MSRISHLLNRKCAITPRGEGVADGLGGYAETSGSTVPASCRLVPATQAERTEAGRRDVRVTYALILEPTQAIERGDTVAMTDGREPSAALEVESVSEPSESIYVRALLSSHERAQA